MAEVVKTGLLAGEPLWELPDAELVRRCAAFKSAVCLRDPARRGAAPACSTSGTRSHTRSRLRPGTSCRTDERSRSACSPRSGSPAATTDAVEERARTRSRCASTASAPGQALQRDKKGRAAHRPARRRRRPRGRAAGGGRPRGARRADRRIDSRRAHPRPQRCEHERARAARPQALRRLVARRARVADLPVGARRRLERAVQADEQRGRARRLDPRGARLGRRRHRQSGRVDALQLRDPRRARAVRGADRRGASVERRRAGGVAAASRSSPTSPRTGSSAKGPWDTRRRSNGCRRTSERTRGAAARDASRSRCSSRPASNVRYLIGFQSSNAALLVDEERVLLFTDFRYAEAARSRRGRRVRAVAALPVKTVAETLDGARRLRGDRADLRRLADAAGRPASSSSRARGLVERLRAVKDEDELAAIREAARITDDGLRRARRGALRRPHRTRRRVAHGAALPRARARTRSRSRSSSARARRARCRTAARPTA